MKNKVLIVVDMQNDFIDGSLGTPEAQAIVPKVVEKIKNWDGDIVFTKDTHYKNYLNTREGRHLPIEHCLQNTPGHNFPKDIDDFVIERYMKTLYKNVDVITKSSFGSYGLPELLFEPVEHIEIIGLCTDICVISNAIIIQSYFPETEIYIDASCCAGTTPEMHRKALDVMRGLQMNIINDSIVS